MRSSAKKSPGKSKAEGKNSKGRESKFEDEDEGGKGDLPSGDAPRRKFSFGEDVELQDEAAGGSSSSSSSSSS